MNTSEVSAVDGACGTSLGLAPPSCPRPGWRRDHRDVPDASHAYSTVCWTSYNRMASRSAVTRTQANPCVALPKRCWGSPTRTGVSAAPPAPVMIS